MTVKIRGCPGCARSVRAELETCPHCGMVLALQVELRSMDEAGEVLDVEAHGTRDGKDD